jgi:DNA-binding winged helix-turn-helix (wHTH) protein/Tol biopolymer transport system component
MGTNGRGRWRFGDFEFDREAGKLYRDGHIVRIQPQPLRVLELLVERPGEILSREELRNRIWGEATFVEFDQGLNYCIRQIRSTLGEAASQPSYIETLPKQGYRFIASVTVVSNGALGAKEAGAAPTSKNERAPLVPEVSEPIALPAVVASRRWLSRAIGAACVALVIAGVSLYFSLRSHSAGVTYTQLTDFTDSAVVPALSPDGHMLAFIRGTTSFLTVGQVYVKVLPDGEAKAVTDDPRMKYSLAFSPDGSQVAYSVLEGPGFSTYAVSILGGDVRLLLNNAAGLTWLYEHQLLFSRIRSGMHLGIVTGPTPGDHFRELYFPPHERAMAHYSYASPDRRSALVVEMAGNGGWGPCRIISLDAVEQARAIGPDGPCTAAGWSPDGTWMYFIAAVGGQGHLWRQRFPNGHPQQLTFGPADEEGLAVEQNGRSVITSVGVHESAIWLHTPVGDRSLSSEGEVETLPPPVFNADGTVLYYLMRRGSALPGPELWRTAVESGKSEPALPGIAMLAYDVSPDGKQVVYSSGKSQLWLAPLDRSSPPKRVGSGGETSPHFGPAGQILFRLTEGNFNYLARMNQDSSGRSKVVPYPISEIQSVSPGRRWVMAVIPFATGNRMGVVAIPADGGASVRLCDVFCVPAWSSDGRFLSIPVDGSSRVSPGRSLAIPIGPGENLPPFPPGGIKELAEAGVMKGAVSVPRENVVLGLDPDHYAYVNTTVHRNLYRITLR